MKLSLPSVTLVCADCSTPARTAMGLGIERAIDAIERSKARCDFGDVKFLTSVATEYPHLSIPPINDLNDYSAFCLKSLPHLVSTSHVLIVQWDGWVLNPESWRSHWLSYDYMGPLFMQERMVNAESVGVGGFSLRSKRLMLAVDAMLPPLASGMQWGHEDGTISKALRPSLLAQGMKFAPPDEAAVFAQGGNPHPQYHCAKPFGFHRLFRNVDLDIGIVAPYDDPPQSMPTLPKDWNHRDN